MAFTFSSWPNLAVHCVPQTLGFFFEPDSGPVLPEREGEKWTEKGNAGADSHPQGLGAPELSSLFQVKKLSWETHCSQHCFGQEQVSKSFQTTLYNNCVRKRAKWTDSSDGEGAVQDYWIRTLVFIDINPSLYSGDISSAAHDVVY